MLYKPGKANVVADALSRIQINSLTPMRHMSDDDDNSIILSAESPINVFKNQMLFQINETPSYDQTIQFQGYRRHTFKEPHFTRDFLKDKLKQLLNPKVLNGIYTSEPIMAIIQDIYKENFNPRITKVRFSQKIVQNLPDEKQQIEEIKTVHCVAHKTARENVIQLLKRFYFSRITKITENYVENCEICSAVCSVLCEIFGKI